MNMQLLKDILTAYGPSGHEGRVADVVRTALEGHVDEIYTDAMGSLIAVKKGDGTGRRIMASAHMDHIGMAVVDADKHGFLRVCNVGGIRAAKMVSGHVVFGSGARLGGVASLLVGGNPDGMKCTFWIRILEILRGR